MKVNIDGYVPYGPVGHSKAQCFAEFAQASAEAVFAEFWTWLGKHALQGEPPTMFFCENMPLEAQGYYILPVRDGEVSDALLATLQPARMFVPANEGEPGRKLETFARHVPSFTRLLDREVWQEGTPGCDHDVGLESWTAVYRTESRVLYAAEDSYRAREPGQYFATVQCTRCGACHAYPEQEA